VGRWSQSRKRGTAAPYFPPNAIPDPPGDSDWTWSQDPDGPNGIANLDISLPAGAIGWQLWGSLNGGPFAYGDQDPAGTGFLTFDFGGATPGDLAAGKVRWIVSGAGEGDPDTVYSDFSATKSFDET